MDAARITPEMAINYKTRQQGISVADVGIGPIAVVSWSQRVIRSFAEIVGARTSPHWFYQKYEFYTGELNGQTINFVQVPIGAPGTVMIMEELIACGARIILGLGWAGSLQESAPVGTLLIPTDCISEEGTSAHYVDKTAKISADEELVALMQASAISEGRPVLTGTQWTLDAFYRELCDKIDAYRARGVIGVDMETSAMYMLGGYRGVKVCNLLIVSDEVWHEWRPAFGTAALKEAAKQGQRVMMRCLYQIIERSIS
jgi:uridine phosphorylase